MFVGHFALGFAGKRVAPRVSLGALFLAAQFLDLLWPTFLLLGLEVVRIAPGITAVTPLDFVRYPYSHSLVATAGWSALFAIVYWFRHRDMRASLLLGLLVSSHWILDFVTHRPDLPLSFSSEVRVGLGLWYSRSATLVVELLLFLAGVVLYARATRPRDRIGRIGFWVLVGFLVTVYLVNIFGPPPPSVAAVAWGTQLMWLLVLWGFWLDRHRAPV